MKFSNLLDKKIRITQIKSRSKLNARQKGNLVGIGVGHIGSSVEVKCTNPVVGMLKKVAHVIKISLV